MSKPALKLVTFDDIKHIDSMGNEYWSARELMAVLGYKRWENFHSIVQQAIVSAKTSNPDFDIKIAFRKATKSYTGKNRFGEFSSDKDDYHLSRYACYLIAQNGDSSKKEIANAQSYFALQTYRQEQFDALSDQQKRVYIRNQVRHSNKKLFDSAKRSGVTNFGEFNDAGYYGLYGLSAKEIRTKKGLGNDKILDRAGNTELAANLFRITQTDDRLSQGDINDAKAANNIHYSIGNKVRKAIRDIGGTMPEDLPPEENISKIERQINNKRIDTNKQRLN
ncbi:MAG: DNA damage-inducible protein D [Candidatus Saccharibacteria bacterium]|nr:DNA damage-inducible protein D [Candidatus Saccharibacteria bacterium]